HAQKEIRLYAKVLFDITKKVAPSCCEAFERHVLGAVSFSQDEFAELQRRLRHLHGDDSGGETALTGKALKRFEEKLVSGKQQ
ncbi:MAG: thymidylate synthase (FAD), partial [Treponema sp.]|nr:thymidylate synthase (FAD) [Treponema sp.]